MQKRFFLTAFLILLLDQLSKLLILRNFSTNHFKLSNFLQIKYIANTGAAFGILQNQTILLAWFSVIVIGVVLFFYDKITSKNDIPLALILGGTIGNLIDRLSYGYVVDYIDFSFWPAFNIADIALTIGVLWLIFFLYRK